MNANTALKINDAISQAVSCGESIDSILQQVKNALERAIEVKAIEDIRKVRGS